MRKLFAFLGICGVALFVLCGIHLTSRSDTVDFTGTVTDIRVEGDTYTFYLSHPFGTTYVVVADANTDVSYHRNEAPVSLSDIQVGDTFSGDYRWFSEDKADCIEIEYHKQA